MKSLLVTLALAIFNFTTNAKAIESTTTSFKFPFSQGDAKWQEFKTSQERIAALQIPESILSFISTEDLLYVCIDFPYLSDVFFFDDMNSGLKAVTSKFNGLQEFLTRQDQIESLKKVFALISSEGLFLDHNSDLEVGENSMKICVLSYLLGRPEVLNKMTDKQKEELLQLTQKNLDAISHYSFFTKTRGYFALHTLKQLLVASPKSQIDGDYQSVTRNTPNGSPVLAWILFQNELSDSEKIVYANIAIYNYGATIISEATKTYNCHAYAWHMTEGGDSVWIGLNSLTDENVYWEDDSYVEVPEPLATKVSYYEISDGNHSAIRLSTNLYRSKWGNGPLVEHAPNQCPYNTSMPKRFYAKAPVASGSTFIFNSGEYTIQHLINNCTVSWSLTGANASNFTIQNNYPSTNQCTITRNANSTFSGSTSLILSAQIKYNGTTVHTITKNLVAPYISGTSIPCNTENYHVKDLPGNTNVSWSVSGTGLTGSQLHPGYLIEDSINSYYVSRTAQGYASGTVSATVQTSENTTATLTKRIDTGGNFTGTWYQIPSTLNPDTSNSSPAALQSGGTYILNKSQSTVLQSSDFINASITTSCNGMSLLFWSNPNNGTITFTPARLGTGNTSGSAIVEGWKSSTCETFRLNFSCIFTDPIFTLGVSASGQDYTFTLQNKQTDENGNERTQSVESVNQPWKLSVVQYDTGLTVYEDSVSGTSMTVNASRWKPGIYIVIATIGDDMCVQKITVK